MLGVFSGHFWGCLFVLFHRNGLGTQKLSYIFQLQLWVKIKGIITPYLMSDFVNSHHFKCSRRPKQYNELCLCL